MSRCFPFPPPGYEKQPRAENLDLLAKEKRKEKKHKKEKKEQEKRERKEKKEKDRSKDKRKEKKDRKEKHKDRKKDKDVDQGRSSEDRKAEGRNEGTHNRESLQKAAECNDSKFAEELGKRTRDDGAANPMVGSITSSIHRKIEQVVVSRPSLEKDRVTDKKVFPVPVGLSQRNDGSILPVENAANFPPRRIGNISTTTCTDQERSKLHDRFNFGINTDQSRDHGISRSIEGLPGLVNRKTEYSTAGVEKEKIAEKKLVSSSIAPAIDNRGKLSAKFAASNSTSTKGKNDALGLPLENLSSLRCKTESMGNSIIQSRMDGMEKDRFKGSGMLPHPVTTDNNKQQQHQAFIPLRGVVGQHPVTSEQRRNTTIFQPVQKDRNQKVDKKDEVTKGLEDKERTAKKNKPKDDNKHTEEEEKISEKPAMIENNKIRSFGKKDQIGILNSKPLAPHKDSSVGIRGVDETSNKRKNIKINGFIQENDARPNKIPRLVASSSQPPFSSGLPVKSDIILDNKDKNINGSAKSQQLPDGNGEVSLKSPHPDSKYLEQIYTVPKMEPWLENDDVEWLFNRCDSSQQKPKPERQAASEESIPQVWAKALRIESADVLALPYVVPF